MAATKLQANKRRECRMGGGGGGEGGSCGQRADQVATKRIQSTWHKQRGTVASHKDCTHTHTHTTHHCAAQWTKERKKEAKQFPATATGCTRKRGAMPRLATLSK